MTTATGEELLTVAAVAAIGKVGEGLVLKWIDTGQLAAVTLAAGVPERRKRGRKSLRVYRSAWEAFVASRTLASAPGQGGPAPAAPAKRSHAAERLAAAAAKAAQARAKMRAGRAK